MAAGAALTPDDTELPDQATPSLPPIQGAAPVAASPLSAAASPLSAAAAPPPAAPSLSSGAPAGGIAQGTGNTKGEIKTPDVVPQYDPKKLAKAQTTLDLLNAMKPASRTDYMDWWEKQHGQIDAKYDALRTSLGARPSEEEPQTKPEKFAALLEFGLHLMKASAPASTNQGAALTGTLADSVDAYNQAPANKLAAQQKDYDTQASAIESARDDAQKGIGTPADAMKAQLSANRDDAENLKDTATAYKDVSGSLADHANALGAATYAVGPGGVIHSLVRDSDGHAHAEPVTGIDGKPFAGKVLGKEAGSGIDKGSQDTASIRNQKYLTGVLGVDPNTAAQVAFKAKSGNPNADHAQVFKAVLSSTMGDTDKAKRAADQYVLDQYGAAGVARANSPLIPAAAPPAAALQGLKPGTVRDFGPRGKWTVGIDGKPVAVNSGPQTIQ